MEDDLLLLEEIKFCDKCQKNVKPKLVERFATYTFKGETFEILERVLQCPCGEDLFDEKLDSAIMKKLVKLYQERVGLTLEEIKAIRSQYGLSMELFARILGWSKSTIARYETGKYIPDSSHLLILKQLKENPEAIYEFYKVNKHKFTEKEQQKINGKLSHLDRNYVERSLFKVLNVNYKSHENTIESGYRPFNLEKLINMILFFSKNGVQKTKLMKLLFYSDFLYYKRNLVSITGTPYVKFPYGPVPKDHDLLLSTIEKNQYIDIEYTVENDYIYNHIISKKRFDERLFNDEEINILYFIENFFKPYGSKAISEYSHQEDGWKYTQDREIISYDFAETLSLD